MSRRALAALAASACALVALTGCSDGATSSSSSGLAPKGAAHTHHLQGGVFASGGSCPDCHAASGFGVDFSQNPAVHAGGATFDPAAQTCSNVSCHGAFTYGSVSGSFARPGWNDTTPLGCASCHAMPPAGHPPIGAAPDAKSCSGCHADSVKPDGTIDVAKGMHLNGLVEAASGSCSACHGDAARVALLAGTDFYLSSAPPIAPQGAAATVVGAHLAHMNPTAAAAMATPVACSECHVVPTDSAHATAPPAQKVAFGTLASTGGARPAWNGSTGGCSATWCHGTFTLLGVSGSGATPLWSDTGTTCTSCHAMPPAGHPPLSGAATAASCSACHPQSVDAQGLIVVAAGTHVDGKAQTAGLGCTTCHGDAARLANLPGTDRNLPSSPPVSSPGAPAYAVGAHLGHVNPTAASFLMPPVPCAECHVVPADSTHSNNPPAQRVVFGPISRTGGAVPTWSSATTGCAATYCHGNFTFGVVKGSNATPLWTTTASLACTGCHGMPPTGHPTYTGTPDAVSCFQCHPQSVNADGTIKQGGGHVNGKADGGDCTSCHGDPPTTGEHGEHRRERCDACHPTGFTSTTVVAPFHDNGTTDIGSQAGYSCGLTGCPTGTRGSCTNTCHGRESW